MNAVNDVLIKITKGSELNTNEAATVTKSPDMEAKVSGAEEIRFPLNELSGVKPSEESNDSLEELAKKLNETYRMRNVNLNFSIDEETNALVVKVIDADSDTVIRQIPPEEILALKRNIREMMGTIFDREA